MTNFRPATVARLAVLILLVRAMPAADVFPGATWEIASPTSQGLDAAKLEAAVDWLKANAGKDGVGELVIVRHGRVIWQGDATHKVHGIWSSTKSFTSTCLGLLIDEGKCTLDTRAKDFVPALAAAYPDVTLRHFATMTSGYRALGDEPQGTYRHGPSRTPFTPDPQPLFAPGAHYCYWDSAMNQFGHVLTRIAGEPLDQFFKRRIADPIGMDPNEWRWGHFVGPEGLRINGGSGNHSRHVFISARQIARLGLLFLHRGAWNGRQLVSSGWVDRATKVQVPAHLTRGSPDSRITGSGIYGLNWWVNGRDAGGALAWPEAPAGAFAAMGHNNNVLFVIPEWNMVIARLGLDGADRRIGDAEWSQFLGKVGQSLAAPLSRAPAGAARPGLTPAEVAVIAMQASPESRAIAEHYIKARGIPASQLLLLPGEPGNTVSPAVWEGEMRPAIRAWLAAAEFGPAIRCLVTCWDVPLKIGGRPPPDAAGKRPGPEKWAHASFDSELSLLAWSDYPREHWVENALHYANAGAPARPPTMMVARLAAPTVELVKRLIDTAIATEQTGLTGTVYLDARGLVPGAEGSPRGNYAVYDQSMRDLAQRLEAHTDMKVVLNNRGGLFQPGECPEAALYCGWYSLAKYVDAFDWRPGAVGYHIASSEAVELRSPGRKFWCNAMLEDGIGATLGPTSEPLLSAMPLPDDFFSLLLTGDYTLVETYYRTQRYNSWQMTLVGDPLYTPFKHRPRLAAADLPDRLKPRQTLQ